MIKLITNLKEYLSSLSVLSIIVGTIGGIIGIIGGILGIFSFFKMRKKEKEPYFKNVFCEAENTIFEPIRKMIKYSLEIQEKLLPSDALQIVQNSALNIIDRAVETPTIEEKRKILNTTPTRSLPSYNMIKEQFQTIGKFLSRYTLKYDKQLQKSVSKIYKAEIKIFSAVESYNSSIGVFVMFPSSFNDLEKMKRLSNSDLTSRCSQILSNYEELKGEIGVMVMGSGSTICLNCLH